MAERALPVFICLKWGVGYPVTHTNVLYRALSDHMSVPFRMICLTDDPAGLDAGIEAAPLPDFATPRARWVPGMWPKLAAFRPGLVPEGAPCLLIDVDMLVLRDLAPLFAHVEAEGGLHIIRDWHDTHERWFPRLFPRKRGGNSSLVGWIGGQQTHLWSRFAADEAEALRKDRNDQIFINRYAEGRRYWPAEWVLSFKRTLAWHMPVNLVRPIRPPREAFMIAFHGRPDIEEVAGARGRIWGGSEKWGLRPVPWIRAYWERYAA